MPAVEALRPKAWPTAARAPSGIAGSVGSAIERSRSEAAKPTRGQIISGLLLARGRAGVATASVPGVTTAAHTAVARLDAGGTLTLQLDDRPVVTAPTYASIGAMPADGLDVGSDEGGAVGPYSTPHPFAGIIESVVIELDSK